MSWHWFGRSERAREEQIQQQREDLEHRGEEQMQQRVAELEHRVTDVEAGAEEKKLEVAAVQQRLELLETQAKVIARRHVLERGSVHRSS